ncbi:unnamed protein product [Sphagnum jensenii]|uniref:Ribosomal protein S14 n=1 Tax=Sphagnum jensenii TaxID=128206 RepID=A0ABP1B7Z0_9BRYO
MEFVVICQDLTELTRQSTNSARTRSSAGSSVVPLLLPSQPLRDLPQLPRELCIVQKCSREMLHASWVLAAGLRGRVVRGRAHSVVRGEPIPSHK